MTDTPRDPDGGGRPEPDRSPPRMPGWVKWPGIVTGVLVAVLLVLRLFGVEHGPGRHMPGGTPPSASAPGHAPGGNHR